MYLIFKTVLPNTNAKYENYAIKVFQSFLIGKKYNIDNCEMKNAFNMLDHLLMEICYTATQTQRPKM